ncbi:MAG TPA: hypothetical protein DCM28_13975 [Phycisphaerales bacterium]|nr:hypothetical protein [Phycisphaerales bacterium]HCD35163.1 hypothetical protein [Phycisphaerales bacterium]
MANGPKSGWCAQNQGIKLPSILAFKTIKFFKMSPQPSDFLSITPRSALESLPKPTSVIQEIPLDTKIQP